MSSSSARPGPAGALRGGPRRAAALLATGLLLTGCGAAVTASSHHGQASHTGASAARSADGQAARATLHTDSAPAQGSRVAGGPGTRAAAEPGGTPALPGVGPGTSREIPASTRQAVLVTGSGRDTNTATFRVYRRDGRGGWVPEAAAWSAHNALNGWSSHHAVDDRRSPIGVFGLTDAGGRLADPGTRLPYDHTSGFTAYGTGFDGEPLAGAFDYVIAINYNRDPGTSPLNHDKPLGAARGGGIWIHVDHGGPTQGCVSIAKDHVRQLLRMLDPSKHPVIVMGDAASLAH
jgi:L,D-peptidoglycan transpeptidase YkuD (ErfK/YbiS/YcfS/YnhG family)